MRAFVLVDKIENMYEEFYNIKIFEKEYLLLT